jgi:hypothetical protein
MIRVLRGPSCWTRANNAAAWDGCNLTQPCEAGPPSRARFGGAVNGEAIIEEDRVRHRRIVVLPREPAPRHGLRPKLAARRAVAAAAGRDRPIVSRSAVQTDRHALGRFVDLDHDVRPRRSRHDDGNGNHQPAQPAAHMSSRTSYHDRVPLPAPSATAMMSFPPKPCKDRRRRRLPIVAVNPNLRADRLTFGKCP